MKNADLDFAAECTLSEGWLSETRREIEGFLDHDSKGCFIAESDGRRIGICIATCYGESGFIGELIVIKEMRGQGIGRQLVEHSINYLVRKGTQSVYLDGVQAAVPLYERIGFRKVCRSLRFVARIQGKSHPHARQMQTHDLPVVLEIDKRNFGANRSFFLKRRWTLYPELCKVYEVNMEIKGFIFGRRGQATVSIGPWVVKGPETNSAGLLEDVAMYAGPVDLGMGILETNTEAVKLAKSLGFRASEDPPWRMAFGTQSNLGASDQCLAIGSAAKG
jgi:ribosomal protein S18 acetylase RimI-like enzyme